MPTIKKMTIALAGMVTFRLVHASTWFPVPFTTDSDHVDYSIDLDSITRQRDGSVMAWFKADYGKTSRGHSYTNVTTHVWAFCVARLISIGPTYWHSADGDVVDSRESISPAQGIVPDSIGEGLLKSTCVDWTPIRQALRANQAK